MNIRWVAIAGAGLLVTACTSSGNVERNAAGGAVLGGIAGAVIGNNVGGGDAGARADGRARLPAGRWLRRRLPAASSVL